MTRENKVVQFGPLFVAGGIRSLLLLAAAVGMTPALAQSPNSDLECRKGFVWREATANDHVCVTPETQSLTAEDNATAAARRRPDSDDACLQGYVWRMATPQDHVCVTQLTRDAAFRDNRLAASRLAISARTPPLIAPSARMGAPYPPLQRLGCHHLVNGRWQDVPCVSREYTKKTLPFPPPGGLESSIQSNPREVWFFRYSFTYTAPIVWGSVAINILTDPSQATENDSSAGANAFSIQTNANQFNCTICSNGFPFQGTQAGDVGWVQFVYQPSTYGLCVWNIDLSQQIYQPTCVSPVPPYSRNLTGNGAAIGAGEVFGYVFCPTPGSNSGCTLNVFGYLPWAEGWYSVTGVPDLLGLAGNWTNVSGTILGEGGGSEAVFAGGGGSPVQIQTFLRAYSCFVQPQGATGYTPQPCPPPNFIERRFELDATDPIENVVTNETNNLTNGQATFVCEPWDCWLSYVSSAP